MGNRDSLLVACKKNKASTALQILADPSTSSEEINQIDEKGWTALIWASYNNLGDVCLAILRDMRLSEDNINQVPKDSATALHRSISKGLDNVALAIIHHDKFDKRILIQKKKAGISGIITGGKTPLEMAMEKNRSVKLIKALADLGGVEIDLKISSPKGLSSKVTGAAAVAAGAALVVVHAPIIATAVLAGGAVVASKHVVTEAKHFITSTVKTAVEPLAEETHNNALATNQLVEETHHNAFSTNQLVEETHQVRAFVEDHTESLNQILDNQKESVSVKFDNEQYPSAQY